MLFRKGRKRLWHDWLWIDFLAGIGLMLLVLSVSVFGYGMRYPKLCVTQNLVCNLALVVLLLPFLTGVFGLCARESGRQTSCCILTALGLPVLLCSLAAAVFLLFLPPFCSSTDKEEHYLQMDRMQPELAEDFMELFPENLPTGAREVNYRYFKYASFLEETIHLTAGVTLDEEGFAAEQERLMALELLAGAERREAEGITLINAVAEDTGLEMHVTIDQGYQRIIYTAGYQRTK